MEFDLDERIADLNLVGDNFETTADVSTQKIY
jgi:hypothetical protein